MDSLDRRSCAGAARGAGRTALLAVLACFATATGAPAAPAQEWCRCDATSFSWNGCDASGACDAGAWTGCTPSSDDGFTIGAGCHVDVGAEHDVLLAQSATRRVRVEAGGTLSMRGPIELRLGPAGLHAAAGSSVSLRGCFREHAPGGSCAAMPGATSLFEIGRVVPCQNGDCAEGSESVRIVWSADLAPAALARVDRLLDRIDVPRDVLCFWQRDEDGAIGPDAGYCYNVTAVGRGSGDRTLDFDVRQVWAAQSDQAGAPLARRSVQQLTLANGVSAGTRRLRFADTTLVEGRAGPVGRWLRCAGDQKTHLIASADDDSAGDTVLLADRRGVARDYAAGTRCTVGWGWREGDEAFVMAPVHVTSSTNRSDEAYLLLEGATTLRAVVADGLGGAADRSAIEVRGGPLVLEHVWVADPLVTDTAAVLLEDLPCETSISHLLVTGGPPDPSSDKNYALAWYGGPSCRYSVRHFYTRFAGDDQFVLESSGAKPLGSIDLRWVQAGPSALPGDSGQLFDFGISNPTSVRARDVLCTACTSDDGFGSLVIAGTGPGTIGDLLWVGVRNGAVQADATSQNNASFGFRRLGVVGSLVNPEQPLGGGTLTGIVADQFYVRDVFDPRENPARLCVGNPFGSRSRRVTSGVFLDVRLGGLPCVASDLSISDVYFLDVTRTGAPGPLLEVQPFASAVRLSGLTMTFTREAEGVTIGVSAPFAAAAPELTLDGLLLDGFGGPDAIAAMTLGTAANAAQAQWESPTCFHDNAVDEFAVVLAAYGVPPVRGVDPDFVDPAALRFDLSIDSPLRAVGCGAGPAGVRGSNWAHRKADLEPVYVGPRGGATEDLGAGAASVLAIAAALAQRLRGRGPISRG